MNVVRGAICPAALFVSILSVAACGGGGGSSGGGPVAPVTSPTPAPGGVVIAITIPTAAPIVANPATLTFAHPGSSQMSLLTENAYGGSFASNSSNATVATASVARNSLGEYVLTVAALATGSATIALTSDNGGKGAVSVTVLAP